MPEIDERDVRLWFMKTDLEQAEDTFRVVEGIIETRKEFQPKRKKRSDAGTKKLDLREQQENDGTYEMPDTRP
jgi:hypothetical protein